MLSPFLIIMDEIFRFLDKFWMIKMYENIYLRKNLFFEICSKIMVFVRMNPPYDFH